MKKLLQMLRPVYVECGVTGGFLFLVIFLATLSAPPHEAGTCTVPKTWVFDELLTETDLNGNFAGLLTCINGQIDDTNIRVGANIDQDKLETLYNNSVFEAARGLLNDHDSRHEPNGADEMNDLDIANTGTNVSLHASRHASSGPDPLPPGSISSAMLAPGLLAQAVGRQGHNADTATMTETAYTMDARPHFTGTLSSNGAAVDLAQCADMLYVLESGSTDRVWRITPSTMAAASPSQVALTAGDDPYDIECAPDGSVYITTNNAGSGRALKRISTTGTLTTVVNLSSDLVCGGLACGADNLAKMTIDPNGVYAFIIGQDGTETNNQFIYRVPLAGGNVEEYHPATVALNNAIVLTDLEVVTRNGVTRLWVGLNENDDGGDDWCCIFEVNHLVTPMTGDSGVQCGGGQTVIAENTAGGGGANCLSSFEHDGVVMWVYSGVSGGGGNNSLWRLGDLARIGTKGGNPVNSVASTDPRYTMFTGLSLVFQDPNAGTLDFMETGNLNFTSDTTLPTNRIDRDFNIANTTACGLASDGRYMYICADNASSQAFSVAKHFIYY